MADRAEEPASVEGPLVSDITEKFDDGSSSSDSDNEKREAVSSVATEKIWRFFGRQRPLHDVLGGGKRSDLFLWRDKKVTSGMLVTATAIWALFELFEYHLLTLVCHILIFSIAILFLWSNATIFINKPPPRIPDIQIDEDLAVSIALHLRSEVNCVVSMLRGVALGRDLRKFLAVVAGLWFLSVIGDCCNFLTLSYTVLVLFLTLPALYEKYENKIDALGEKASIKIKQQYAVFDARFLGKIPSELLKIKKH